MEKLKLVCGRFIPPRGGETAERVERLEVYLSKLTQELEQLVREVDRALAEGAVGGEEPAAVADGGKEEVV